MFHNMVTAAIGSKSGSLGLLDRSEKVLEQIDRYADEHFLHIVNRKKGLLLEKLVRRCKPKLALETGTLVGYSAIRIAKNLPKNGRLVSIEINKHRAEEAKRNIMAAMLADKVEVVVGEALSVISTLRTEVEFVFFDVADYFQCLRKLEKNGCIKPGCVVVANNVRWFNKQLQPYLAHVRESGKYKSAYYDLGFDGMEVSIRR